MAKQIITRADCPKIAGFCGGIDPRTVRAYLDGAVIKPTTAFAIRTGLKEMGLPDPRVAPKGITNGLGK